MNPKSPAVFLCAVDGSDGARRAAHFAAERARAEGATLRLAHVIDWSPYEIMDVAATSVRHVERQAELEKAQKEVLDPLARELSGLEVETRIDFGHPAESICKMAEDGVTQVFCGRRGRRRIATLLFGSVTSSLVQACPKPLTVVP